MANYRYKMVNRNIDGNGLRLVREYIVPVRSADYWQNVTDIHCPACQGGDYSMV